MVALTPYYTAAASLSASTYIAQPYSASSVCKDSLVTSTVTVISAAGESPYVYTPPAPVYSKGGHGAHGSYAHSPPSPVSTLGAHGSYDNPYNKLPLPFEWPGKPSHGEESPLPMPSPPYSYGGSGAAAYKAPAWIPKGHDKLKSSLPKGKQNGNSQWGDINCPHLPVDGLPGGPTYPSPTKKPYYPVHSANKTTSAHPTGTGTGRPTNPDCPEMPETGVTRTYEFHVAYETIAPDGVPRNGLLVNGQFPGPLVEANWGDWILIKVRNDLHNEGTAIHAHGLLQNQTPWYDGVPSVSQCPLVPNNGTMDMLFRADRYGTSWWHSHYSAQYSGGAHGPMIIYGPRHQEYDIDIGPVLIEDWYHQDYFTLVNTTMNGRAPPSNNNLINGKMQYPCANTTLPCNPNAGVSKFRFQSGKKHLLRLINAGAEGTQKFSIDNHTLTVVAQDFVPIEPYTTNVVTLGIGQRADVIVEAKGSPNDAVWMRAQLGTARCTLNDGISPNAVAAVYYENADSDSVPASTSDVTAEQLASCKNDPLTQQVPICTIPIEEPATTEVIDLTFRSNGTNFLWHVNNQTFRGDYNNPILLKVKDNEFDFKPEWNVFNFGTNSSVRLHVINHGQAGAHPMHLHGHDFHVLAEGFGTWDGVVTNPSNSARRDVHILQNAQDATTPSYMVLQYTQDNPGVWPFHCHLAWHVSSGLFLSALERPEDIKTQDFDEDVIEGCEEWHRYTGAGGHVNQIDSGL